MSNEPSRDTQRSNYDDVMLQLTEIFGSKGWLGKDLRISHQDKRYRIACNEQRFLAYRINENCGLHPGVPGWPVCLVYQDYLFDESESSGPTSVKLSIQDWVRIIANEDFKLI